MIILLDAICQLAFIILIREMKEGGGRGLSYVVLLG